MGGYGFSLTVVIEIEVYIRQQDWSHESIAFEPPTFINEEHVSKADIGHVLKAEMEYVLIADINSGVQKSSRDHIQPVMCYYWVLNSLVAPIFKAIAITLSC